ncbi:hypothetical protein GCM10009605_47570 [Nocardiopsis composta]
MHRAPLPAFTVRIHPGQRVSDDPRPPTRRQDDAHAPPFSRPAAHDHHPRPTPAVAAGLNPAPWGAAPGWRARPAPSFAVAAGLNPTP